MDHSILLKIKEHQQMAAYHNNEATRLIEKSLGGAEAPPSRKGKLSPEFAARLVAKARSKTLVK